MTSAPRASRRSLDEQGSATVVMLGVIAAILLLTVSGLLLASAVLASHRARTAADLAALAAAGALIRGEPASAACDVAARVAEVNHGRLGNATGAQVQVVVAVPSSVNGVGVATARSRAGPEPHGR